MARGPCSAGFDRTPQFRTLSICSILGRNTLKDFYFRHGLMVQEDEARQSNSRFWELIESAHSASKS